MNLPLLAAVAFILAVTTMNIVATIRLVQAPWFSRNQKIAQLVFLWFLPVVGFAVVWHFLNEMAPPRVTTDLRTWLESDDIAHRLSNVGREENIRNSDHGGVD
jgi:hypothetical protein